eukprot:gene18216-20034_t
MPKNAKKHNESSEGDADAESANAQALFANAIASNPALMQAVQDKLNGLVGKSSGYIENLPEPVKKRVNYLKNLQVEYINIEGRFYQAVHALEVEYAELFKPIFEKRKAVIAGDYEPTEEEGTWVEPGEEGEEDEEKEEDKKEEDKKEEDKKEDDKKEEEVKKEDDKDKEPSEQEDKKEEEETTGISEFWLTAMKNVDTIASMIEPHDEPILSHLTDIKLLFSGKAPEEEESTVEDMGFALEFHFSENEYFTNSSLTKSYKIRCEPDKDDPFSFEGTEIVGCTGCSIDWKKGKNVTEKIVKKKQKHKGKGQTRVVTKTVKNDSFFNFFDPPKISDEDEDMDEDTETLLAADFEIGHFFRERLIPKAVLFFTGEAIEEDEDDDEFDEDEDDDELDEDEDPDYNPPAGGEKPQECKQQ